MEEVKTAKYFGVMEITRINVECPYCEHELEIPYSHFVENIGEPWLCENLGHEMTCSSCKQSFKLGEFEVQE